MLVHREVGGDMVGSMDHGSSGYIDSNQTDDSGNDGHIIQPMNPPTISVNELPDNVTTGSTESTNISEKLYVVCGHWVLPLVLAQGYIGPMKHRRIYRDDFMAIEPGVIPLFGGPLDIKLFEGFSQVASDSLPFVLEIDTSSLSSTSLLMLPSIGIGQYAFAAYYGCIPMTSVTRVIIDSEKNKQRLLQARTSAQYSRYDDVEFVVDPEMFTGVGVEAMTVEKSLPSIQGITESELCSMDTLLDRVSGGMAMCLWLQSLEVCTYKQFNSFVSILETFLTFEFESAKDLGSFFSSIYQNATDSAGWDGDTSDAWLFAQICKRLMDLSVADADETVIGMRLIEELRNYIEIVGSLEPDDKHDILRQIDQVKLYKRGLKIFDGKVSANKLTYPCIIPFLLAVLGETPDALVRIIFQTPPSDDGVSEIDYLIACFIVGMMTGRRKLDLSRRESSFDEAISGVIADRLSGYITVGEHIQRVRLGVVGVRTDDSDNDHIFTEISIDESIVHQKEYSIPQTTLAHIVKNGTFDELVVEKACIYLCVELEWHDCIETTIQFAPSRFISHSSVGRSKSQLVLKGIPEIMYNIHWDILLDKLTAEESNIGASVKETVMEMLDPISSSVVSDIEELSLE